MDWDGWLRSSDCLEVLKKCSASLIKNSRNRYIIERCKGLDRWEQTDKEKTEKEKTSDEYLIESLSSDLWLFLQGFNPTVDLIELIVSGELSSKE